MRTEAYIRTTELVVALSSTYMVAVALIQSSIYISKIRPLLVKVIVPFLMMLGAGPAYFDIFLLGMVMIISFLFWRRGDEVGFGRLFSLNMLMFFPVVIDFSIFNWVNLILPYHLEPKASSLWVFGVGLLLQATYLTLRYTVRFRVLRDEMTDRGAELENIDEISRGQMTYLAQLVLGTAAISIAVFYLVPVLRDLLRIDAYELPYPHIIIGVACSLLIASATILYLRGGSRRHGKENLSPSEELGQAS